MTPGLLILIGAVALAFSLLILRAEPGRWDNRAFAVLGLLDAAMALYRGVAGLFGASLLDPEVLLPCALLAPLLADESPLVRGHAAWAWARLASEPGPALSARLADESHASVRQELVSALDESARPPHST